MVPFLDLASATEEIRPALAAAIDQGAARGNP